MSLVEIEEAVDKLSPEELTKLAAHIARRDKLAWDKEIDEDFSPGRKYHEALKSLIEEPRKPLPDFSFRPRLAVRGSTAPPA